MKYNLFTAKTFIIALALSTCFLTGCIKKAPVNLLQDLEFIHDKIIANHPGVYNELDPDFNANLETFYQCAKHKIQTTKSTVKHKRAITEFAKSFKDNHLSVYWHDTKTTHQNHLKKTTFSISYPAKDIAWITVPTFFNLNAKQEKDYNALLETMPTLQNFKHIVFDVRGNTGGNSAYGTKLIGALFSEEYTKQKRALVHSKIFVDWRVSEDNVSHVKTWPSQFTFASPEVQKEVLDIVIGTEQALKNGEKYYRQHADNIDETISFSTATTASIYVIIDSFVASAALGFVDDIKIVSPSAVLIGQQTSADRLYMEINGLTLPSGLGTLYYPVKVYRNRPRGDNEPYKPDIEFKNIANTKALKKFVLKQIK